MNETLLRSFHEWLGKLPESVVHLRHEGKASELPEALDVYFFDPDGGPNDDDITTVATAGLSTWPAAPPAELAVEVRGTCDEARREQIAHGLGALALAASRAEGLFAGDTIVEGTIPPFSAMTHLLLKNWGISEETLPGTSPPVVVLWVIPLFSGEARLARQVGGVRAVPKLRRLGAAFEDFERPPSLPENADQNLPQERN